MFRHLRARKQRIARAADIYVVLVEQARQAAFYRSFGVPDTMGGRFEMVCLHAYMVFRRLAGEPGGRVLAQAVHDRMFADFDLTLREQGIGDMGVGKRIKKLASGLYGRIAAYDEGLAAGDAALGEALRRNLYAGEAVPETCVAAMAVYLRDSLAALETQPGAALMAGDIRFIAPAAGAAAPREAAI